MSLAPRQIGFQDLAALIARQPDVSQRARAHMMASPFGTIHAATFSFPQPVGTVIPEAPKILLASMSADDVEITGSPRRDLVAPIPMHRPRFEFPTVNRRLKGDRLVAREPEVPSSGTRDMTPGRVKTVSFPKPAEVGSAEEQALREEAAAPAVEAEVRPADTRPADPPLREPKTDQKPYAVAALSSEPLLKASSLAAAANASAADRLARLYFGNPSGEAIGTIQPWPMDEELVIVTPPARDPDIKHSAVASLMRQDFNFETSSATPVPGQPDIGHSVAAKGEVTGEGRRPKTPAERLNLNARQRAKSEKCLADAVYFESRGEPKRGQIAVAQVVMNRVFSGFYPNNVCGVVYQNAHRRNSCQFTFACDGIRDVVNEPDMWEQAKEIARDMLDGKLWLPEIGHSTHYHAYWVHPSWVNEMKKLHKIGVHSFYRPRAWGNTVEVPNYTFVPPQPKT